MENRLKNLKRAMKNTTFRGLDFNEAHRNEIHSKLLHEEKDEDILFAVMQLLASEKTGFQVAKQLRSRGIQKFEDKEGLLYTVLHRMESKGYLESAWIEESGKLYKLSNKGRRLLKKQEKNNVEVKSVLGTLVEVRQ
ncbi:PadR family transcriptional regulator [Bacillus sp. AK031]